MSEIQKLNNIIASLEEQSSKVTEFSGVLSAVNASKTEILSAKTAFGELLEAHKKLVTETIKYHKEYQDKLAVLESKLSKIESDFVTSAQLEAAKDQVLLRIYEMRLLTTEQFKQRTIESETLISSQIVQANSTIERAISAQGQSIRLLRTYLVIGMLMIAFG
ncbi:MAG: hypothetical protein E6Q75_06950, partial [Rheinheimera sp.]